jgi:hypothetical protein
LTAYISSQTAYLLSQLCSDIDIHNSCPITGFVTMYYPARRKFIKDAKSKTVRNTANHNSCPEKRDSKRVV